MAKASAARIFSDQSRKTAIKGKAEVMAEVKQHVEEAAMLLRSLGRDYEKCAWVLEDSLQFLNEAAGEKYEQYQTESVDWASLVQAEKLIYS